MQAASPLVRLFTSTNFLRNYWGKKPYLFEAGSLFLEESQLLSAESLIRLYYHQYPHQLFLGYEEGLKAFKIMEREVGHQLTLQDVLRRSRSRPAVLKAFLSKTDFYANLGKQLEQQFHRIHICTAIVSLGRCEGLIRHCDSIENFIFQHEGECQWQVWDQHNEKLLLDAKLRPGHILYVPFEYFHKVERHTKGSSHISLAQTQFKTTPKPQG